MQLIINNPYRIVGLLAGATAREQQRQIKRMKQFIEAEQEPQDDFSFPVLGSLNRTLDRISEASSKLNLATDKMNAALFWFYVGNQITDEPAFDSLKESDQQNALEIWKKLTSLAQVNQRNCSAFHNLSTLILCNAFNGSKINFELFELAISLKLKFLESDFIKDFKSHVTDETFKITKKELQLSYLHQLQSEIERNGSVSLKSFIEVLGKLDFSAKEEFIKDFVQKPIEQIEKKIDEIKKKQDSDHSKAGDFGTELFNATKNDLSLLLSVLGTSDIKFVSISDKLAGEILQCSITFFNHFYETETEVGEIALELNKKAESIAISSLIKQRIKESNSVKEKYIQGRNDREKQRIVQPELNFIKDKLDKFQTLEDTIPNALDLANTCKPYLDKMKSLLGLNDDLYSLVSSRVSSNAQGMIVLVINKTLDARQNIKSVIKAAWSATIILGTFDMSEQQMEKYLENKKTLKGIYRKVDRSITFYNDTPIAKWILWVGGIALFLILVVSIWGTEGLTVVLGFAFFIGFMVFYYWLRNL